MRRKVGDRRVGPRFEIVGALWGTLETVVRLPLKNVSLGGALIHSHVPLPLESVHRVAFDSGGQSLSVQVRVSRVAHELSADGERAHLIAVEFLSVQPALLQLIERWLSEGQGEAAGSVSV